MYKASPHKDPGLPARNCWQFLPPPIILEWMNDLVPSITELVGDGRHFARRNNMGAMEIVDSISGTIVALIKDPNAQIKLVKRTMPNGEEVWFDETLPEHILKHTGQVMRYHPWLVDIICEKIAQGKGIIKICEEPGMPSYPIFCRWRRIHPEIDKQIEDARRDRAEFHRDKAMDVVEGSLTEDEVAAARLKHDAQKWAAGVDDAKFSPKAKVDVSVNTPTVIMVATGIDRNISIPNTERVVGVSQNVTAKIQANTVSTVDTGVSGDSTSSSRKLTGSGPGDDSGGAY